jgi:tetratricopeptide (TPR) repeat protein
LTTVALLADALVLDEDERSALARAAVGGLDQSGAAGLVPHQVIVRPATAPGISSGEGELELPGPVGGWHRAFVGRAGELLRLEEGWLSRQRIILITGEAGIGKTRLADQFARLVGQTGAAVVSGRWSEEQLGPFEGFVGMLRQAVELLEAPALVGCGDLVRLLPELSGRLREHPVPTRADPGIERRLLFEAIARALGALGPTLVLLDDLHWADKASLGLLAYLAAQPDLTDVVLVATLRSTDVSPDTAGRLAELGRRSDVYYLPLGHLELPDLTRLVKLVAGDDVSSDWALDVARASEGNAFFAEELAEHLLGQSEGPRTPLGFDGISVPDRIRLTVDRRFGALSSDAQAVLRCGCILGREFDPHLARRIAGLGAEDAMAGVEDALLSGLIIETSPTKLSFAHALVQKAVDGSLSSLRRIEIHRRAAAALEEAREGGAETAIAIARHWRAVASADPAAAPSAARWAVRAGDAALAAAATDEAIAQYELASDWWAGTTAEHIDALIRLAAALSSCGRSDEADARFTAALTLAKGLGDVTLQARAALGLGRPLVLGSVDTRRIAELEDVISLLKASDDSVWTLVAAMLMRHLLFDRSPASARRYTELSVQVVANLDRTDIPPETLLGIGSFRDFLPITDPAPLDRLTKQMIAVASERRELLVLANAWWGQAWSALERGDPVEWPQAVAAYQRTADELGLAAERGVSASLRSVAAQIEGRLSEAESLADEALRHARAANDPNADTLRLARTVLVALETGRAAELLPAMVALAGEFRNVATFQAGLALTAAVAGDHDLARHILSDHAEHHFRDVPLNVEWPAVIAFFSHTSALVGDQSSAADLYDRLVKSPAVAVRVGAMTGWWGPVDHHVGALCHLLGRLDEAQSRLERAVAVERALNAAPFLARTQLVLASVIEELEGIRGAAEASALREEACGILTRLGLRG